MTSCCPEPPGGRVRQEKAGHGERGGRGARRGEETKALREGVRKGGVAKRETEEGENKR